MNCERGDYELVILEALLEAKSEDVEQDRGEKRRERLGQGIFQQHKKSDIQIKVWITGATETGSYLRSTGSLQGRTLFLFIFDFGRVFFFFSFLFFSFSLFGAISFYFKPFFFLWGGGGGGVVLARMMD